MREPAARVWCENWRTCRSIGDPGFTGGEVPDLCNACERRRMPAAVEPQQALNESLDLTVDELASIPM